MERKIIILAMIPFLLFWHWFEPAAKKNRAGIDAYQQQKYEEALEQFLSAKGVNPDMAELKNNTAAALYQIKKYREALEEFSQIDPEKAGINKADFHYNLANSFFRDNQLEKALEHYKESLKLSPSDLDTKKNFELTLKKMEEQQKKDQQKKDEKNQDKKNQDKKNQNEKDRDKKKQDKKDQQKKQDQQKEKQQQQKQDKHKNLMKYLDQKEKDQLKDKNKRRRVGVAVKRKEKDW